MKFCQECGSLMTPEANQWICDECGWTLRRDEPAGGEDIAPKQKSVATDLERLPTTDSGAIRKQKAMGWLEDREVPSDDEIVDVVTPKPDGHTGSTYPTAISNVRFTGNAEFIESIAGLMKPFLDFENSSTRLEINLQKVKDKDTDEYTGNYALYLSVARRSR